MPLHDSQKGTLGEYLAWIYGTVGSDGELVFLSRTADMDHVDLAAGRRGGTTNLDIQVKMASELDRDGYGAVRAEYAADRVRESHSFVYVVLLVAGTQVTRCWLIPSAAFNAGAYRHDHAGRVELQVRAHPESEDRWSPFRLEPTTLGRALLDLTSRLPQLPVEEGPPALP